MGIAPLQTYHSALAFAPLNSIVRRNFLHISPQLFNILPAVSSDWSAELQKLEGHTGRITAVAFSPNGEVVASSSQDRTLRLWNAKTGEQIGKLDAGVDGHEIRFSKESRKLTLLWADEFVPETQVWDLHRGKKTMDSGGGRFCSRRAVAFSPNGQVIAIAAGHRTVRLFDAISGRQMHLLEVRFYAVTALAFLLDGSMLASGSTDGMIRLWNVHSGVQTYELSGHNGMVTDIAATPHNDHIIASASLDGKVRLWNACTGVQMHTLPDYDAGVSALAFSPGSKFLAIALDDQTVRLCDAVTGEQVLKIERGEETDGYLPAEMAVSPVEQLLAVAMSDCNIQLWDLLMGKPTKRLKGHASPVIAVDFSPDGSTIASSSFDRTIRLWNSITGKKKLRIEVQATLLAFSYDGTMLASESPDNTLHLFNTSTGEQLRILEGNGSLVPRLDRLSFLASDGYVACSRDGTVLVWDTQTGKRSSELQWQVEEVTATVLSSDGQLLATVSNNGTVELWNVTTGDRTQKLIGHERVITSIAVSLDGQLVAAISWDRSMLLWSVQTGKQLSKYETPERHHEDDSDHNYRYRGSAVAFSPNGELLAVSLNRVMRLHSARTGEITQVFPLQEDVVEKIAFSPDCKLIAVASNRAVGLWSTSTAQQTQKLEGHSGDVSAIAFSPDGESIATASTDTTVRLWTTKFDSRIHQLGGHKEDITLVKLSPNGQIAASASRDHTILLWDVLTGKIEQQLEGHCASVTALAFSPSGLLLASASAYDGATARVWHTQTGDRTQILGNRDSAYAVIFSPGGLIISTAEYSGKVRLWNPQTGEQIRKLEGEEGRDTALAFSPDSRYVATVSTELFRGSSHVALWNAHTGEQIQSFLVHRANALCFSPSGETLSLAGGQGLSLWNLQTGEKMQTLEWPPAMSKYFYLSCPPPTFSNDRKSVQTSAGTFDLNWKPGGSLLGPLESTTALDLAGQWIRHKKQDLLYLPHEYRGECFDTYGDRLVIGRASGVVTFLRLTASPP